jgi:hypothetical protein
MKLILVSIIASTAAFTPSQVAETSSILKAFENDLGTQNPLVFFDDQLGNIASYRFHGKSSHVDCGILTAYFEILLLTVLTSDRKSL